jgi:hypothetical protein
VESGDHGLGQQPHTQPAYIATGTIAVLVADETSALRRAACGNVPEQLRPAEVQLLPRAAALAQSSGSAVGGGGELCVCSWGWWSGTRQVLLAQS